MMNNPPKKIEISSSIVFRTASILLGFWFLYAVRDVLALLFISVIIVSSIEPAVDWMQKKKIPRAVSVLGIYILLFALIGILISFLIPPLVAQSKDFSHNFSQYSKNLDNSLGVVRGFLKIDLDEAQLFQDIGSSFASVSKNIFSKTVGFFSGFISIIVVLSLTFYMSVKEDAINSFVVSIAPEKHKKYVLSFTERIKDKIGKWMLGQLLLMFIIGVLDFIGLYLAGVPYALILAIFAGIMEIIPYMGPIISAIPGIILGFLVSPTVGFFALLVYMGSQQLENHIITPQIMKKAVGLNPIAVILALLVGVKLGGVFGAIIAIPVATAISIFIKDLMERSEAV
jgi:predicted PurR-regulated permease PerM